VLDILTITGPIYLCIALGWLATRAGLFERGDMRVLGQFVLYVALPALLFDAVSKRRLADILEWRYMAAYALGGLATVALSQWWLRRVVRQPPLLGVVQSMGMACPNSGFVGYPINLLVLGGSTAAVVLGLSMVVENLLLVPLLMTLADAAGGGRHWRAVLRSAAAGLARNPLVLSLLAALAASILGLSLPAPVERTVGLFAQASAALSLFVIGGSLAGLRLRGLGKSVAQIAAGKLVLHPLLTGALLLGLEALGMQALGPELRTGLMLTVACPMFGIYPILAGRHGQEGLAAAALLGTTVASFFTISAMLWLLG